MFYTVILGHFIASVFACLGLANACYCIGAAERELGGGVFFPQLAAALWPLAVAAALEILLMILQQLELINLRAEEQPVAGRAAAAPAVGGKPAPEPKESGTKEKAQEPSGGMTYFPVRETTLAPVADAEGGKETAAEEKKAEPESPAPAAAAPAEEAESKEDSGLQFFKLR